MSSAGSEQPALVRLKKGKYTFEVATRPRTVKEWRAGNLGSLDHVLFVDGIFTNFSKGDRARDQDVTSNLDVDTVQAGLEKILREGTVQVSAAEKREDVARKKKEIVNSIHKNYLNPKTKLPYSAEMIKTALDDPKVKFRVDPMKEADQQVEAAVKSLMGILTLRKSVMDGTLIVPHSYVGSCSGVVHSMASIEKEDYVEEGCKWKIQISPGDFDAFFGKLTSITKGDYQWILAGGMAQEEKKDDSSSGKKGKKKGKKGKKGKK